MNVFLRELKAHRKSMITWALSLGGIVGLFMALYPAFEADIEGLTDVLANFPEAIKALVNITPETFLSVLGFYGYLLSFAWLAASIQAMNLGVGIISKEIAGKTADFLITKPVRRSQVVTAKLAAAFTVGAPLKEWVIQWADGVLSFTGIIAFYLIARRRFRPPL